MASGTGRIKNLDELDDVTSGERSENRNRRLAWMLSFEVYLLRLIPEAPRHGSTIGMLLFNFRHMLPARKQMYSSKYYSAICLAKCDV